MLNTTLKKRLERAEAASNTRAGINSPAVYGIVDKVVDGVPNVIRCLTGSIGNLAETDKDPNILVPLKLERLLTTHKKHKGVYGGRAGAKSILAMNAMIGEISTNGTRVFCLRERMTSLRESIYEGINTQIKNSGFGGYTSVPSQWEIRHASGGKFKFGGLQNVIDMKGAFEFKIFFLEEAARVKQETLDVLGPTLRGVEGAEIWYLWNPESSTDAMSNEFITPFQADIDRDGYYEDDHHLIIKVTYEDNPWFMGDSSLRGEYEKDKAKVESGRMSKARFNWIWGGMFRDDIENALIEPDWFDACIDAHKKLGFEGRGSKVVGFDPADTGNDAMGYAGRTGVVFDDVQEIEAGDGNRGFDIACRLAKQYGVDSFGWDCDGMGAILRDQAATNFGGTKAQTYMYKGSEGPHEPNAVFKASSDYNFKDQKKNKDVFKNKRAQNYTAFAERVKNTYRAVVHNEYVDPDEMVSFDSGKISPQIMAKLRSEFCRLPLKPSDKICLYSKDEMRRGIPQRDGSKIVIPSPNLADACVLSFDKGAIISKTSTQPLNFNSYWD